ncbi:MAG TPA: YrhC family protein [Bacillales bacterium]|nr:YrhC family protein [Bacillales bacterium]
MEDQKISKVRNKMTDYTHFAFTLLFLSAFMELGSVLPFPGKTGRDQILLSLAAFAFILAGLWFHRKVLKLKHQIDKETM